MFWAFYLILNKYILNLFDNQISWFSRTLYQIPKAAVLKTVSSRPPCKIKPVSFTYIIYCTSHNNIDPLCLYLTHRDVELADTLGQKIFGCCMIVYLESASLKVEFTEFLSVLNLFYTIIKPFININSCCPSSFCYF